MSVRFFSALMVSSGRLQELHICLVADRGIVTLKLISACFVLSFTFALIGSRLRLATEFTLFISTLLVCPAAQYTIRRHQPSLLPSTLTATTSTTASTVTSSLLYAHLILWSIFCSLPSVTLCQSSCLICLVCGRVRTTTQAQGNLIIRPTVTSHGGVRRQYVFRFNNTPTHQG